MLMAALAGCTAVGAAVGAGATVGVAGAQERGVKHAASDSGIKLGIYDRLLKHDHQLFARVSATVVEGRVLLTGAVRTEAHRAEAGRLAQTGEGVREVINEIQVTPGGGILDTARDAWISTQIRVRILGDSRIADINYAFETVNGVVYLIGIAQDEGEIVRVSEHARNVSGVKRVVSHVILKSDPRRRPA